MKCYITFGSWNIYYKYILLSTFFLLLNYSTFEIKYNESFTPIKILPVKSQDNLSKHILIHKIFGYLGTIILALIFYKCEKIQISKSIKKQNNLKGNENLLSHIKLIYTNYQSLLTKDFFILLLIFFILIIYEIFIQIYMNILKDLDFWMIELLILSYINEKMFDIKLYKHQKLAIRLNLFICIFKIISIILSSFLNENKSDILYIKYKFLIPIGIIIYLLFISLRSYANTKLKWFIDLKYVSVNKLLIIYGIIGTIISSIIVTLSTFIKCPNNKDDYYYQFFNNTCEIQNIDDNKNLTYIYFENFKSYFKNLKNTDNLNKNILFEIIIIIIGFITFFFYKYYSILIIKNFSPVHFIFSSPIYFFVKKIILPINTYIDQKSFFIKNEKNKTEIIFKIKYILDFSSDIISLIAFLIYLEIIELNFCQYNYNLKKNISKRALNEFSDRGIINDYEDEDEDDEVEIKDKTEESLNEMSAKSQKSIN